LLNCLRERGRSPRIGELGDRALGALEIARGAHQPRPGDRDLCEYQERVSVADRWPRRAPERLAALSLALLLGIHERPQTEARGIADRTARGVGSLD
jgi:hypothetical protein